MTERQANELAGALDLGLDGSGVCEACLSFVAFALAGGDEREVQRTTAAMAPALWEDGLEAPVRAALERARGRDVGGAEAAIADVERRGPRARIMHAIVRRLADELVRRDGLARPRAPVGRFIEIPLDDLDSA